MDQDLYNLLSLIVQVAVGGVVGWYTLETKKIRTQGEKQLRLLRFQFQRSVAPYLFSAFRTGEIATFGRACIVFNPTDRPAHDISVFVFDGVEHFFSLRCIDTLGHTDEDSAKDIQASGPISAETALEAFSSHIKIVPLVF